MAREVIKNAPKGSTVILRGEPVFRAHKPLRRASDWIRNEVVNAQSRDFLDLQPDIAAIKEQVKQEVPNYSEQRLGAMIHLILGPLSFPPSAFQAEIEHKEATEAQKILSATLAHDIAYNTLAALAEGVSTGDAVTMHTIVKNLHSISRSFSSKNEGALATTWWTGTRVEMGLINTLLANGYKVFIPETQEETFMLDILNGIDLVAVAETGEIFLINAKSDRERARNKEKTVGAFAQISDITKIGNTSVRDFLVDIARTTGQRNSPKRKVIFCIVNLDPTSIGWESNFPGFEKNADEKRTSLRRYLTPVGEIRDNIVGGLNSARGMYIKKERTII